MGKVYRARDRSLKREVAIKILPEEFSQDADRLARFEREAEVLASLNHPNIAGIYDLAEANGSRYLVLELVEGETLADRLAHGHVQIRREERFLLSLYGPPIRIIPLRHPVTSCDDCPVSQDNRGRVRRLRSLSCWAPGYNSCHYDTTSTHHNRWARRGRVD